MPTLLQVDIFSQVFYLPFVLGPTFPVVEGVTVAVPVPPVTVLVILLVDCGPEVLPDCEFPPWLLALED